MDSHSLLAMLLLLLHFVQHLFSRQLKAFAELYVMKIALQGRQTGQGLNTKLHLYPHVQKSPCWGPSVLGQ